MSNIVIDPSSGILEFNTGTTYGSAFDNSLVGAARLEFKNSGQLALTSYGTGVSEKLTIDGSNGRLFTVDNEVTGSIFSVNDAAGLPIVEVFSDDRVVMGEFASDALVVSGSSVQVTGSQIASQSWVEDQGYAVPNLNEGRLFVGNSSNEAVADDTVFVDIASGNVGIGTTSPSQKLHAVGSQVRLDGNGGGFYKHTLAGAFRAAFYDDGATTKIFADGDGSNPHMTFNAGNVGIGTTSPSQKLHVVGSQVRLDGNGGGFYQHTLAGAFRAAFCDDGAITKIFADGDGNNPHMTFNAGLVGIGTSSPSDKLEVYANGADVALRIHEDAGTHEAKLHLRRGGYDWEIINNGHLEFKIEESETVRFTTNGNVGIGTTAPDSKLHVVGSVDSDAASLGSEIVASQTASGTNWSGSSLASGYTHSAGSTDLLVSNLTPIINRLYRVEIQTTNVTAGRLDKVIFGGVETTVYISSNLTRVLSLKATSTGPLTFQCQSAFVGTVTVSSVKEIVASDSLSVLTNSGGNRLETRVFGTTDFFLGDSAGENRVSSSDNIGIGYGALRRISTAGINLAIGNRSLSNLVNGSYNVAIGHDILGNYQKNGNTYNIGIGNSVMSGSSMTGHQNIIMGFWAGPDMTSASGNLGIGYSVFGDLTSGSGNLSLGNQSLRKATSGGSNIALGGYALQSLTTTSHNIAIGYLAGRYAIGNVANETPSSSIYIGYNTKASANGESNQIVIGYNAEGIGANTVTLGNDSVVTTALKGDVGIGTTSPSAKLHAYQTISTAPSIVSRVPYKTNADAQLKQRAALRIDINEGSSSLSIGGIGSAHGGFIQSYATNSTSTHRNFVLNPFGGNVGIGFGASAAPTEKLHVNGTFKSTGASYFDSTIEVGSSSAGGVILTSPGGGRFLVTINNSGELQSSSL